MRQTRETQKCLKEKSFPAAGKGNNRTAEILNIDLPTIFRPPSRPHYITDVPRVRHVSLCSKRFRRFFCPFEAFFAFWRRENYSRSPGTTARRVRENWGERNTDGRSGKGEGRGGEKRKRLPAKPMILKNASPSPPPSRTFLRSPQFSRV